MIRQGKRIVAAAGIGVSVLVAVILALNFGATALALAPEGPDAAGPQAEPAGPEGPDAGSPQAQPVAPDEGVIDIGPELRQNDLPLDTTGAQALQYQLLLQEGAYEVGDTRIFAILDDYFGTYRLATYEVRVISDSVEIWVQMDLRYRTPDLEVNPVHPGARDLQYITQDRLEYLAHVFEDIILPTEVDYFGEYDDRTGEDATFQDLVPSLGLPDDYFAGPGDRVIVLVSNVRDGLYYEPENFSSFIAGFVSPTLNGWADRNFLTLDIRQWDQRMGAPSYGYEAIATHEFQHLILGDYDPDEDSWINEGLSEFSEFVVGYRPRPEDWREQFQDFPENALTIWGDQDEDPDQDPGFEILADYHQASWFLMYMAGRLQDDAGLSMDDAIRQVTSLTRDPAPSVESINALLEDVGVGYDFEDLWLDFRIAMLYGGSSNDTQWGDYISQYIPPSGVDIAPLDLGRLRRNLMFEGYDTPGIPPFGTDYIEVGWSEAIEANTTLDFNGDTDPVPTDWSVIPAADTGVPASGDVSGNVLFSGHTDLTDNFLVFSTTVPAEGDASLAFDTLYNIESDWDYGFVQVTTDTEMGTGWTSLAISGTTVITDPNAHPIIKANVPGFSGVSGSGDDPQWVHKTYDLTEYAGDNILLAFRYSTDWGAAGQVAPPPEAGWYVDNVMLGETPLYTDEGTPTGSSIWIVRDAAPTLLVNVVTFEDGNGPGIGDVYAFTLDPAADGTFNLGSVLGDPGFDEPGERVVILVSAIPPEVDTDLISIPTPYVDYTLMGLPPSIYTSRIRALGSTLDSTIRGPAVYPGDNVSLTVTVDNFGRNDDLSAAEPVEAYVAVPIPEDTMFVGGSLSATVATENMTYTTSLQELDGGLPVAPGVYWHGTVSETAELSFVVEVDAPIATCDVHLSSVNCADEFRIEPMAYIANGPFSADPSQEFVDRVLNEVTIRSPLDFSQATAMESVRVGDTAVFSYTLVNTDNDVRDVDLRFQIPAGIELESLSVNLRDLADIQPDANGGVFHLGVSVPSLPETGLVAVVRIELRVTSAFPSGTLNPQLEVLQPGSDIPYTDLELDVPGGATVITGRIYLPVIFR